MAFERVVFRLFEKGLNPIVDNVKRVITFTGEKGDFKRLVFDNFDQVKSWTSIDFGKGTMKTFEHTDESLWERISKITKYKNEIPQETKTVTSQLDTLDSKIISQEVKTENHVTGEVTSKINQKPAQKLEAPEIEPYKPLEELYPGTTSPNGIEPKPYWEDSLYNSGEVYDPTTDILLTNPEFMHNPFENPNIFETDMGLPDLGFGF